MSTKIKLGGQAETGPAQIKISIVNFINAINIGGDIKFSVEAKKHGAALDKTATGVWIRREKWPDRWVPDSNIKWFECE